MRGRRAGFAGNAGNTMNTELCGRKTRICEAAHAKNSSARNANVRNDAKTNAAIWKGVQGNAPANRK